MTTTPTHHEDFCDTTVQKMRRLNSKRRWAEAIEIGMAHKKRFHPLCPNPEFWVQLHLPLTMLDNKSAAETARRTYWSRVPKSDPKAFDLAFGDMLRDLALMHVRLKDYGAAKDIVRTIQNVQHKQADANRQIVLRAILARIAAETDDFYAMEQFNDVYRDWLELGESANQQWFANHLFHQLRYAARHNMVAGFTRGVYSWQYGHYMSIEHDWKKRLAARLMWRFGSLGVRAVDRLAH